MRSLRTVGRATGVVLAIGAAAVLARVADDGRVPQPGDVVEPIPRVDSTVPVPIDAGPVPDDASAPVEAQTHAVPNPTLAEELPAEQATPRPTASPAPSSAEPEPRPAAVEPIVVPTAPRVDPAGERSPATTAPADPAPPADNPPGLGFGAVPALNYDADNGFGFGVIGNLYWYDGATRPYRAMLMVQIFLTTKLLHDHYLSAEWLKVAELPLRLSSRIGYLESRSQNYCGIGGAVTCDPAVAAGVASQLGLEGADADQLVHDYYLRRFINPYGQLQARWALVETPARFELMAGYRANLFIPGTWDDADGDGAPDLSPFPHSAFADDFPNGEPGFESQAQLGVMLDTRDNEPAPTEGVWLEASARASSPLMGSAWSWAGGNLTLRGYASLDPGHTLVLCSRLIADGVVGDPPIQSLARMGGSSDAYLFGGGDVGRGIRAQRYLGKLRVVDQTELRWDVVKTEVLAQRLVFTAAGFVDGGIVGREIADPGPLPLQVGLGGALRVAWNENFIIRFDVGASSVEAWQPMPYLLIGNAF
ncbi:MAG: BamA/TamA family outer membrane protein [Deltaproteobacteria bacterium]|nr:BamA/TamA family outer membrane protein [Deltaproteobacteria bacterium]